MLGACFCLKTVLEYVGDNQEIHKLLSICFLKDTHKKVNRQVTQKETIFKYICDN
jgi:hypothetical protein